MRVIALQPFGHGPRRSFAGDSEGDQMGAAVASAGDVNADGYTDVIVGAPFDDNNNRRDSGSCRVLSGKDGSLIHAFNGEKPHSKLGLAVAGAGDVNGDGFADVIVGSTASSKVFSGLDGKLLWTFGSAWSVSGAGDVDGNGFADVVIGFSNEVNVYSGKDGKLLRHLKGSANGQDFGRAVGSGDFDGDGFSDILVGAPRCRVGQNQVGCVFCYSVKSDRLLWSSDGTNRGDQFGFSVANAGDVNGTGKPDVVVGAPGFDKDAKTADSGAVYVLSHSGSRIRKHQGDVADQALGYSVSSAGDIDADGFGDVIVGAPGSVKGVTGRVEILSGGDGSVLRTILARTRDTRLGHSVAAVANGNRDGLGDFVVGAPAYGGTGQAQLWTSWLHTLVGITARYGFACPDTKGNRPRIGISNAPVVGERVHFSLVYPTSTPMFLAIGWGSSINVPVGRCRAFLLPVFTRPPTRAAPPFFIKTSTVANDAKLIGLKLTFQWALEDPVNKSLLTSDAIEVKIGSPSKN